MKKKLLSSTTEGNLDKKDISFSFQSIYKQIGDDVIFAIFS